MAVRSEGMPSPPTDYHEHSSLTKFGLLNLWRYPSVCRSAHIYQTRYPPQRKPPRFDRLKQPHTAANRMKNNDQDSIAAMLTKLRVQ